MYTVRCPCPEMVEFGDFPHKGHCSQKRAQLHRGTDKQVAIKAVMAHLQYSTYHKLEEPVATSYLESKNFEEEWVEED